MRSLSADEVLLGIVKARVSKAIHAAGMGQLYTAGRHVESAHQSACLILDARARFWAMTQAESADFVVRWAEGVRRV